MELDSYSQSEQRADTEQVQECTSREQMHLLTCHELSGRSKFMQGMPRLYQARERLARAPQGGDVLRTPKVPTLYNYNHDVGDFEAVPHAPPLGEHAIWVGQAGGGAGGAADEVQTLSAFGGDTSQWLQREFQRSGAVHVLQITEDDVCETVLMMPACHVPSRKIGTAAVAAVTAVGQDARVNPFATVTIRLVHCKDGLTF